MKTSFRPFNPTALTALFCALTLAVVAQDTPPAAEKPTPPPSGTASATPTPPAADTPPAATPAPTNPADAIAVEAEQAPAGKKGGLRRIDVPANGSSGSSTSAPRRGGRNRSGNSGEFPIGDHFVPKGGEIRDAVSVMGSTTVEGEVHGDAVSVLGNTTIGPEAKIDRSAVAVLGYLSVEGTVRDNAVSVLGGSTVNGKVGSQVVSVLGDMHLGPKADIGGDIVIVGGKLTRDPGAIVHGNEVNVPVMGGFGNIDWLIAWVKECALKGRLLAFGPHLGWAWGTAFSFFAFYVLLGLLFPRGIEKCAVTLETRPGSSVLASVLTVLLTPVATILLAVTVVGVLVVPFLAAGLFCAGLFGKAVMLAWIGRRFTKFFGDGPLSHPVFAVSIGGLLVMLLYTVWGSILIYKLLSWLGLGVVVYTIALSMKRERPAAPPKGGIPAGSATPFVPTPPPAPVFPTTPVAPIAPEPPMGAPFVAAPLVSPGFSDPQSGAPGAVPSAATMGFTASAPPPPVPPAPMPMPPRSPRPVAPVSAATAQRATFGIRLAAMLLDVLLVAAVLGFFNGMLPRIVQVNWFPRGLLFCLATYGAIMWKLKGTTIAGIVCGLKVVRVDGRELDWTTAWVRAVSCFLSLCAAGLGFIWVAFDDEKQSWHDKIAGTTVVRVPKGVSLL